MDDSIASPQIPTASPDPEATAAHTDYLLRLTKDGELMKIAHEAASHIEATEQRERARRESDAEVFRLTVQDFIANAFHAKRRGVLLRVNLTNARLEAASRYKSALEGPQLRHVYHSLVTLGYLSERKAAPPRRWQFAYGVEGHAAGRQTLYWAGPKLCAALDGHSEFRLSKELWRVMRGEPILLRGDTDDHEQRAELIEYGVNNKHANAVRPGTRRMNQYTYDHPGSLLYTGPDQRVNGIMLEFYRVYTRGSWVSGGRHHGPFYQKLSKLERLRDILFDGDQPCEVDYSATLAMLAYLKVGVTPPPGDLYACIKPTAADGNAVVMPRDVLKLAFISLLNGAKDWPTKLRKQGWRGRLGWKRFSDAVFTAHPALKPLAGMDVGQTLTYTEASIMENVIHRLHDRNITVGPVFDCAMVARKYAAVAASIMREEWQKVCRFEPRIAFETLETLSEKLR